MFITFFLGRVYLLLDFPFSENEFILSPATLELEEGTRVTLVIVIFISPKC